MKYLNYIISGAVSILIIVSVIFYVRSLRQENKRLSNNQEVLLNDAKQYMVRDSLSVIRVKELELKLSELEHYRVEDLELIEDLKISKSSLESIISANTETITRLKLQLRDSIKIVDTLHIDTLKCFNYTSAYLDITGCIHNDSINIDYLASRDSLVIVENLEKKKLWFIKLPIWLFGYKARQIDVLSKNPNTVISNVDFISVQH